MFVNPSDASVALEQLAEIRKALIAEGLSSFVDAIDDVSTSLRPKPFKTYDSIQTAVGNYVEYRDMLSVARGEWDDYEKSYKDEMERISMYLRDIGDSLGVDSFNTPYGTAYRNHKTSYRIVDWEAYSTWMRETDNLQCVEKRPAKLAVKEIIDTSGDLPPGLEQFDEVEFNVRRPSKSRTKSDAQTLK